MSVCECVCVCVSVCVESLMFHMCSSRTYPPLETTFSTLKSSRSMADSWDRLGKTMEVSEDGTVLTKKSGGNYSRHVAAKEVLSSGVHMWEVELASGATRQAFGTSSISLILGLRGSYSEKP